MSENGAAPSGRYLAMQGSFGYIVSQGSRAGNPTPAVLPSAQRKVGCFV